MKEGVASTIFCRVLKSIGSNLYKNIPHFSALQNRILIRILKNPDKCWHSKEFRFIYDSLHYLRTKKCHFGSGFTRLIYYPLKSNGNFSWNINRFMWKTLHFRPIHVIHNSYEKEFSIVPFYIHHLPFYHHALIFNIFHHVFMSFFIPTRACVPSQFTTGLQVYPLQIKLYNWPQYCNIFFQKCENIDEAWIWQSSSLCYYWKSILFSIFVSSLVWFQEFFLFSHCHFLKVDKMDFV